MELFFVYFGFTKQERVGAEIIAIAVAMIKGTRNRA